MTASALAQGPEGSPAPPAVDLSGEEYESLSQVGQQDSGEDWFDRWFERVTLGGYGAFAYEHTGDGGKRPEGAFLVDQASLFLEADVSEDAILFFEVMTDRYLQNSSSYIQIGETYAQLNRLLDGGENGYLGLKVGRFDIPFGEYYLYQDAPVNPLISYSVALPYSVDEGLMAFGELLGMQFQTAFLDGSYDRQGTNGFAKSVVVKIGGDALEDLYLSGSFLWNGETSNSALCYSGVTVTPVGAGGAISTLGASPSSGVSQYAYEVDAWYRFGDRAYLRLSGGYAEVDDDVDTFDRDFFWYVVEPSVVLYPGLRATARYSGAGTYDGSEGYQFEGKPYGNGRATYGFDLQHVSRLAVGLAWQPTPNVIFKAEGGMDWFVPIDASPLPSDSRGFLALELVLSF